MLWFFLSKICKRNRDWITYNCEVYDGLSFLRLLSVKPTASRKLTKKTFNGKKKNLTINSCNVKELLINKGLEISSSLGIILTKNLKRAFQSTMSSFLTFIMNYKAEDYHGRSCLFHGGNPLLLHTFRFVFIFSFIFLALKGFFYLHLMLTFHCCSWELYFRNSSRLNLILKFGPYSLFSSEKDSKLFLESIRL